MSVAGRLWPGKEGQHLSDRLQEVKLKNKTLQGTIADYERINKAFGPEEVELTARDAKRKSSRGER